MKRKYWPSGLLLGLLVSIPILTLLYLGDQLVGLPFVPVEILDLAKRALPGPVNALVNLIDSTIITLSSGSVPVTPGLIEQILALVLFIAIGGLLGAFLATLAQRGTTGRLPAVGLAAGLVLFVLAILAEALLGFPAGRPLFGALWLGVLFLAWGLVLGWLIREIRLSVPATPDSGRRTFLYWAGATVAALIASALGLGVLIRRRESLEEFGQTGVAPESGMTSGAAASPPEEELANRIEPAPGTRPEVTANEDLYLTDIVRTPPEIDAQTWRLEVGGLVNNPLSLTLDEIRARPAFSQYITLSCISNSVGGSAIGTGRWTGTRLKDLLEEVGVHPEAQEVYIEAKDGFYESVSMADMMDDRTLLVYEMNGEPLPVEHGFPLRIYIPDRYGMKQPKWILRMELIGEEGPGYWVDRGWSAKARPRTTSVIDNVAVGQPDSEDGRIPIGGIAWAGARGISKVEVRIDDGPWTEAQLRIPPLSPLTWVQWRYDWSPQTGRHTASVRAFDGNGDLQVLDTHDNYPDGATGVHTYSFEI
jgi:DMSO/TMAO reductase YedYZ molybdopterin-dependent catalytic subunit